MKQLRTTKCFQTYLLGKPALVIFSHFSFALALVQQTTDKALWMARLKRIKNYRHLGVEN